MLNFMFVVVVVVIVVVVGISLNELTNSDLLTISSGRPVWTVFFFYFLYFSEL